MQPFFSYTFKATTISPIHIGCDDEFEPTNYFIDNSKLHEISTSDLIQVLTADEKSWLLEQINNRTINSNFLLEYMRIAFSKRNSLQRINTLSIPTTKDVSDRYAKDLEEVKKEKDIFEKFFIPKTLTNPLTQEAIIPGSSIKGAIRTTILQAIQTKRNTPNEDKLAADEIYKKPEKWADYQANLADYIEPSNDIFKYLKIGDLTLNKSSRKITHVINCNRTNLENHKAKKKAGLPLIYEVIKENTSAEFTINIDKNYKLLPDDINSFEQYDDIYKLINFCKKFYQQNSKDELTQLLNYGYIKKDNYNKIINHLDNKDKNKFILKLGRFTGSSSMTLNNRQIKVKGRKGEADKQLPQSTTSWLTSETQNFNDGLPMGWLLCTLKVDSENSLSDSNNSNSFQALDDDIIERFQNLAKLAKLCKTINGLECIIDGQTPQDRERNKGLFAQIRELLSKLNESNIITDSYKIKAIRPVISFTSPEALAYCQSIWSKK